MDENREALRLRLRFSNVSEFLRIQLPRAVRILANPATALLLIVAEVRFSARLVAFDFWDFVGFELVGVAGELFVPFLFEIIVEVVVEIIIVEIFKWIRCHIAPPLFGAVAGLIAEVARLRLRKLNSANPAMMVG
jgi:hypothetical protein